jgi:hypothetical protein
MTCEETAASKLKGTPRSGVTSLNTNVQPSNLENMRNACVISVNSGGYAIIKSPSLEDGNEKFWNLFSQFTVVFYKYV